MSASFPPFFLFISRSSLYVTEISPFLVMSCKYFLFVIYHLMLLIVSFAMFKKIFSQIYRCFLVYGVYSILRMTLPLHKCF